MKLPRDLSGEQLAATLCKDWKYRRVHQVGSHIILETALPSHQRLAIPVMLRLKLEPSGVFFARSQPTRTFRGIEF